MNTPRALIAGSTALLGAVLFCVPAQATPAEGDVVRTDLAKGSTDAPVSIVTNGAPSTLIVQGLTLKPHAGSGWHSHPGTEFSVINAGEVVLQTGTDCAANRYGPGQAVFIPAGVPHQVANEAGQDADVVVTYTVPVDAPLRGDSPDVCAK